MAKQKFMTQAEKVYWSQLFEKYVDEREAEGCFNNDKVEPYMIGYIMGRYLFAGPMPWGTGNRFCTARIAIAVTQVVHAYHQLSSEEQALVAVDQASVLRALQGLESRGVLKIISVEDARWTEETSLINEVGRLTCQFEVSRPTPVVLIEFHPQNILSIESKQMAA